MDASILGWVVGVGGLISGLFGALTGLVGVGVGVYNATKNAKKTDLDYVRGIMDEVRTDLECEKAENEGLRRRIGALEIEKEACKRLLELANKNLEKFTRAINKHEKLELTS